ncbi:MAG: cellobiose phosphorylase [Candidatus Omnitrophica bacterium]|nr:cellobiose phosphorylase [Candidatus Omnitrophota bacterium]
MERKQDKTQAGVWGFIDNQGRFICHCAHKQRERYFPLANELLLSSITTDLHGDSKSDHNHFLLAPVSRIDLTNSLSSRNFWIRKNNGEVWSATGVAKNLSQLESDTVTLEAGLLWHKVSRSNRKIGLTAEILSFVPSQDLPVEIMRVTLTNTTKKAMQCVPIAAIPIYARSANNLRDHRHVTSLLHRIVLHKMGVLVKPTLLFDESGHKPNNVTYFVCGWDERCSPPQYIYPTQAMFCGEAGDLEAPESVFNDALPTQKPLQGKEAMGALRFKRITLAPQASRTFTVIMGMAYPHQSINKIIAALQTPQKVEAALIATQKHWVALSDCIQAQSSDARFDNWFRWVSIQPTLRRLFGCSFLPDFDYGKGGRGWRDLWQDCLGLILSEPLTVRSLLLNNFSGVRIDGSNATIIGKRSGEFIADRNNISRVWMDHGVWPLFTLDLYMHETGDYSILFERRGYFRDQHCNRSQVIDSDWSAQSANVLLARSGEQYQGTILEHVLVQNLVQFFNVGAHNHVRLEGADWNDGLDMAPEYGESVAFSAMYAHNLVLLAQVLQQTGKKNVTLLKEFAILLRAINYNKIADKHALLAEYFKATQKTVSGKTIAVDVAWLVDDLKKKSHWMQEHIRKHEWLAQGFFNGYYDNKKRRVEGINKTTVRMMLSSQVFPLMGGVAQPWQVEKILAAIHRYLYDPKTHGTHLNTDFHQEQHDLGRAFSFVYGDKENGAFFNHMIVMLAYALYKQGYHQDGWNALHSIYAMAVDTKTSKIYPCLPEYFDGEGRGMYAYLTGSASWFVLTLLTQAFGIKGYRGDLLIEPKLSPDQFKEGPTIAMTRMFAHRRFKVVFMLQDKAAKENMRILKATLNADPLIVRHQSSVLIARSVIEKLPKAKEHCIVLYLG